MKNKDLIKILEQLNPENEICIELYNETSEEPICSSYSIETCLNDYDEVVLKVDLN